MSESFSSSGNSVDREIDEYRNTTSYSGSSSDSSRSSGNTSDEYVSGVPGVPLEVFQEEFRTRVASGSRAGPSSAPSSTRRDEVETMYSCAVGVLAKTDERKLTSLRSWYQIPDELNPRLAVRDEWCCQPHFGIGVYEAYLLGGLRLPLNAFARELLTRLGIGLCQLNPNAWRLVVSMQILWREVFEGDCPLTVDEFLFCYKPSEISQSRGFYQFTARRKDCRIIKSLVTSDRSWKTEFFFVSGFWAGRPADVGRDSFPPYTGDLGNLRPEGVRRPSLSQFYLGRVQKARLHPERDFHSLVTLQRLATWGLGPEPSPEALAHEITVRRRMATMKENKGKGVVDERGKQDTETRARPSVGDKRSLSKAINLENLPSRRAKHRKSSKAGVVSPAVLVPPPPPSVPIFDVESSEPAPTPPSKTSVPASSQPPVDVVPNLLESEGLAWERFQQAVSDEDVAACYNMSLTDFEHSGVHDLFKAMSKFIAASRQATELDRTRLLLERRIKEVKDECKSWAETAAEAKDAAKDLLNLVEELKADVVEKDSRLDHFQKKTDELSNSLVRAKDEAVEEFRASKQFTDLLDANYAAGFEDFRMEAKEKFPEVDFSPIVLQLGGAASSFLQTSSEDVNVEDDASTKPAEDDPNA
ncbi:uncharacterized protein LOC142634353 [Castanea sativa]|uniref:uncharacterized protein LOC142634353 n=1 Tax=Castanea sativa TaxID=21020 RepID=UPI003F64CC10